MSLLETLIEEQRRTGLSDRAFARRLGISQALWSTTKAGKSRIGAKLLSAAAREFPSLSREIMEYLATRKPDTAATTDVARAAETSCEERHPLARVYQ